MKTTLKLSVTAVLVFSTALGCMSKTTQPETQAPDATSVQASEQERESRLEAEESAMAKESVSDDAPAPPAAQAPPPAGLSEARPSNKRYAVKGPRSDSKALPKAKKAEGIGLGSVGTLGFGAGSGMGFGGGGRLAPAPQQFNTESYDAVEENRFHSTLTSPKSTFSVDVDTASYSNVRRFLTGGSMPPPGAVRTEELINYFNYSYPDPAGNQPFSVSTEVAPAPWNPQHHLVQIGVQGKRIDSRNLPARNLVFLLDVSGSMSSPNKLPLLKRSLSALVESLRANDRVAIVVYAGASGLVLPSTAGTDKQTILAALERLNAGGSTNGGAGIELAYKVARENASRDGINRVILATDGDFNVGTTNRSELVRRIEQERKSGVFLTVLGFGMGNYKDDTLEQLADKGNGNYAYIDNFREANKVLVQEAGATLVTLAKDVKIQVEFNPKWVGAYRLIGYENRKLNNEDFKDDTKDAGEIGAGHTVTAMYELVPPQLAAKLVGQDKLKYQNVTKASSNETEVMSVSLRYKQPKGHTSRQLDFAVNSSQLSQLCRGQLRCTSAGSENFRFAASLASFAMMLQDSEFKGSADYSLVKTLASGAVGADHYGRRKEFLTLVDRAARLTSQNRD